MILERGAEEIKAEVPLSRAANLFVYIVILAGPLIGLRFSAACWQIVRRFRPRRQPRPSSSHSSEVECHLPGTRPRVARPEEALQIVESENSHGFHAPQEAVRILGEAIDYIRQGQLSFAARELTKP